jgi:hypothetical protein
LVPPTIEIGIVIHRIHLLSPVVSTELSEIRTKRWN